MDPSSGAQFTYDEPVDWSPLEIVYEERLAEERALRLTLTGSDVKVSKSKLRSLETVTELAIINVLTGLLQFPSTDAQAKVSHIADILAFFCVKPPPAKVRGREARPVLTRIWEAIFVIVQQIPADHVWQDLLASVVAVLHGKTDGVTIDGKEVDGNEFWKHAFMSELAQVRFLYWEGGPDTDTDQESQEESYQRWKNLSSFGARLNALALENIEDLAPPLKALSIALEEQHAERDTDCHVWVACEWLVRCAPQIIRYVDETEQDQSGNKKPLIMAGCNYPKERSPFGMERWGVWKENLRELAHPTKAPYNTFNLGPATQKKIAEALKSMEAAESTATVDGAGQDTTVGDANNMTDNVKKIMGGIKETTEQVTGMAEDIK